MNDLGKFEPMSFVLSRRFHAYSPFTQDNHKFLDVTLVEIKEEQDDNNDRSN